MDYIEKYDLQSLWPTQWPWSAIFRVASHLKVSWLSWLWPYLTARPYRMSSSYDHHCQWWFKSINNERCILFSLSIDWDNQNIEIFLISQHKLWKVWLGDRWWVWHLDCGKCPQSQMRCEHVTDTLLFPHISLYFCLFFISDKKR